MKSILTTDVKGTITEAYAPGGDHIDKWLNVAGSGIQNCVDDQVKALTDPTMMFYRVEEDNNFVGYFGRDSEGLKLHTIFIVPTFRQRKNEFFSLVKKQMLSTFYVGGYLKNIPACKFYEKMGATKVQDFNTDFGPAALFKFEEKVK